MSTIDLGAKIPGVGEKIESVMKLAIANKRDPELNRDLLARARTVEKLIYLPGVGPKKAMELAKDTSKLTPGQRLALKHMNDLREKIPRTEMIQHEHTILEHTDAKTVLAGSFRRGAAYSGDIDVLTLDPALPSKLPHIVGTLAHGQEKFMGLCKINKLRRIDIVVTTPEKWGLALMYFTGSKEFNIKMRALARDKGMVLSEHELKGSGITQFYEEEDVFAALNVPYVAPNQRV